MGVAHAPQTIAHRGALLGATKAQGAIFEDVTGTPITVSRALFTAGADKENGPVRGRRVVTALCSTVHSRVWCHHKEIVCIM
jgi:hypothetical protein